MKHHSSSKLSNRSGMEVERSKLNEEPYTSGANIRSLVKQLSPSRSRTSAPAIFGDHKHPQTYPAEDSATSQPKKQARRRLNTSRPYQERLLNMAEVRREVVTALKFHRATMKRSTEQQQQQQDKSYQPPSPPSQKPAKILDKSSFGLLVDTLKPNPITLYYTQQSSYSSPFCYSSPSLTYPQLSSLPISDKPFSFPLPNLPLGLNLNFHAFSNVETPLFCNTNDNNNKSPLIHQPKSSSTSTSSSTAGLANLNPTDPTLHRVMGDEEMEEIRSISEKHDIEWNDIMNSMKTAWWSKFLKAMEADGDGDDREGHGFQMTDIPTWPSDA